MALPTLMSRRNGVDPFTELQQEFDHALNRVFGNVPQRTNGQRTAPYAVDVHEDENHLYFEVELPGFKKDEVEITLADNTLTIAAERGETRRQGGTGQPARPGTQPAANDAAGNGALAPAARRETLLNERRFTYFSRSFTLPPTVSGENVEARMEDGVLFLTLNKREETKPRRIQVR